MAAAKRQVLDVSALLACCDSQRRFEQRSWREVAAELGVSPSLFTRLAQGHKPDVDTFLLLIDWLGIPAENLMDTRYGRERDEAEAERKETLAAISSYLYRDRTLKPESARAIESVLQAAYEHLRERIDDDRRAIND